VPVGREDRIERLHDHAVLGEEREPAQVGEAVELERRQPKRVAQPQLRIGDHRKRHPVSLGERDLLGERLPGEPGDARAQCRELGGVIAEPA
jgi:hypothetical protein